MKPEDSDTVVAIFSPRVDISNPWALIPDSDMYIMGRGLLPHSYVVKSETPDLPGRLKSAGALAVISYSGAAGCVSTPNKIQPPFNSNVKLG